MHNIHHIDDGFERFCPDSPSGLHCYHGDMAHSNIEVCCWCGDVQPTMDVQHGPHAPAKVLDE